MIAVQGMTLWHNDVAIFLNFVVNFFQGLKNLSYFIKGCELKKVNRLFVCFSFFLKKNYFKGVLTYFEGPNNL